MSVRWVLAVLIGAIACDRSRADSRLEATPAPAGHADAAASATLTAPSSPSATASARGAAAWRGSYKSAAGELYIPPDWKNVRWNIKDTNAGLGEGSVALTVDATTGRVQGTLDGPLGPATVDGLASDGKLTAVIVRKDPADQGFTGTLIAQLGSDRAQGTMNVSLGEANAVRTVTFTLSPDRGPAASH